MPHDLDDLRAALRAYAETTADRETAALFLTLAEDGVHAFERARREGHFTASCWLVSRNGRRALLMHHRKLDRWLQPGGHADGDVDLKRVALREAEEETGVRGLAVEGGIYDLDRHRIPARGVEPEHWHYDVRYVLRAGDDERVSINEESNALAWRDIADIAADPTLDGSLRRMAQRWLDRGNAYAATPG
ncbi:NUDIX hydrolase [Oleiagrimonas soli]|uniref:8-oxo-dGTP pyrophosphatase MutT (NUDIX family) n=1 Tax=Oleiagrimonas soli TaxID=1543381 RepID=A0A099CY62_9GAMM|nr:NUDIX hydrolase [Oleiagrimonas soli]KGI77970.1 NUDIX hydrolase [Oleiagrimonas soli]MBB6183653.1 8-oxo-dGTP pyrophosphatase MutT (NUDIX family) [Oleiagrimonas soli]